VYSCELDSVDWNTTACNKRAHFLRSMLFGPTEISLSMVNPDLCSQRIEFYSTIRNRYGIPMCRGYQLVTVLLFTANAQAVATAALTRLSTRSGCQETKSPGDYHNGLKPCSKIPVILRAAPV
jgi:hypothetical protein